MIRPARLAPLLLPLAACETLDAGSDVAAARALGRAQPALEAQQAVLVALDSCPAEQCADLQSLALRAQERFGGCLALQSIQVSESACTYMTGELAAELRLVGCELGLGRPVSGTVSVVQRFGANGVERFFEAAIASGDHGIASCGLVRPSAAGGHALGFDAVVQGAGGGEVAFFWDGSARQEQDETFIRNGSYVAEFVADDGLTYAVQGKTEAIERARGDSLPSAGVVTFNGVDGEARMEFGPETPRTGGIRLVRSDGGTETVVVER